MTGILIVLTVLTSAFMLLYMLDFLGGILCSSLMVPAWYRLMVRLPLQTERTAPATWEEIGEHVGTGEVRARRHGDELFLRTRWSPVRVRPLACVRLTFTDREGRPELVAAHWTPLPMGPFGMLCFVGMVVFSSPDFLFNLAGAVVFLMMFGVYAMISKVGADRLIAVMKEEFAEVPHVAEG